ncbi:MAG: type II secretion system F family protein [Planctomycetota bacterium]
MKFRYEAFNPDGTASSGEIEAESRAEAEQAIRAQGRFPSAVTIPSQSARGRKRSGIQLGQSKLRQLTAFTRQLAVLISSGTPLVDAIEATERQTPDGPWRDIIADVRSHVERGESLSAAMARYPSRFDSVYRSLIQAGESGGDMKQILDRLGAMSRQRQVVQSTVMGAMLYPALLLLVSSGVLIGLFLTVLPRFEQLFESLNAPLPPLTAMLIECSAFVRGNALWIGIGLVMLVVSLVLSCRSESGRTGLQRVLVRLPIIGSAAQAFIVARLARVLGVMLEAKVPLLESLAVAESSARHVEYETIIARATKKVERGESLSDAIDDGFLIPASLAEAIRNGEQTGQVGQVLVVLADMLDEDNAILTKSLTSIMEPAILSLLGVIVGGVALSLFLPLFDLTASTGGAP